VLCFRPSAVLVRVDRPPKIVAGAKFCVIKHHLGTPVEVAQGEQSRGVRRQEIPITCRTTRKS